MDNLRSLFEKAKIKYIVSVDDCYCEMSTIDKQVVSQFLASNPTNAKVFLKTSETTPLLKHMNLL